MKLYKLTNQNWETGCHTKWDKGITHSKTPRDNPMLCSIEQPLCWKAEGRVAVGNGTGGGGVDYALDRKEAGL